MPNETVLRNSIKIFSSKYMTDLSVDINSSYVLNFNFTTTFNSELKRVFEKTVPILVNEPVEAISGYFTIIPKGLNSILACLTRCDGASFTATSHGDFKDFHVVANCYDPTADNSYVGYYCNFCRIKEALYNDLSDITRPLEFKFTGSALKTALSAFDAFNVAGTNVANQQIPFNFTPVLFENSYAVNVFKDDVLLIKGADYSEDVSKVTVLNPVPVTSKITIVNIYNP